MNETVFFQSQTFGGHSADDFISGELFVRLQCYRVPKKIPNWVILITVYKRKIFFFFFHCQQNMLGDPQMNAQSEHCTLEEVGINLVKEAIQTRQRATVIK